MPHSSFLPLASLFAPEIITSGPRAVLLLPEPSVGPELQCVVTSPDYRRSLKGTSREYSVRIVS
jgi:hypothetical protein